MEKVSVLLLILGITCFFLLVMLIFSIIIFFKDLQKKIKLLKASDKCIIDMMIMPSFGIKELLVEVDDEGQFEYKEGLYNTNPKLYCWKGKFAVQLHVFGNPNPLDLHNVGLDGIKINSENQKKLFAQKIIRDLISENKMLIYILVATVISIGIGVFNLMVNLKIIKIGGAT